MRKGIAAMLTGVLVLGVAVAGEPVATQPKIKIGRDTTRITAPLKPDGTPDYVAALNKQYGKGVTPQNNAVVLILQAVAPENVIDEKVRAATLKAIGYDPPAKAAYFVNYPGAKEDPAYQAAQEGLWRRANHPAIAKWLEKNKAPLDLLVAASKRSRFYMPVLTDSEKPFWGLEILDRLSWRRLIQGAEALIIRANLAAGEGRIERAWQDILALHRLGVLMGQDATLGGHLVGVGLGYLAGDATIRLATSGKLTVAKARAILADLNALGPPPDIVTAIDELERYASLNALILISRDPVKGFSGIGKTVGVEVPSELAVHRLAAVARNADFNDILRRINVYFDTLAAAMRRDSFAERHKAYADIGLRLKTLTVKAAGPAKGKLARGEPLTMHETNSMLLGMLLPRLRRAKEIADVASIRRDLATVAVALAACRAEQASYPGQLSALAPKYLKAVPEDFCGGKPFIYRRVGKRYLLYSVGENMRDDGGVKAKPEKDDIAARAAL